MSGASTPATNNLFALNIDGHDLGVFLTVEGLGVQVEVSEFLEGGNPYFVHQIPGQLRGCGVTPLRLLLETLEADGFQVAGHPGVQPRGISIQERADPIQHTEHNRGVEIGLGAGGQE